MANANPVVSAGNIYVLKPVAPSDYKVTYNVLWGVTDADGDALTLTGINGSTPTNLTGKSAAGGALTGAANGTMTYDLTGVSSLVTIDSFWFTVSDGKGGSITVPKQINLFEASSSLIGSAGNDILIGNSLDNVITGGAGADYIDGRGDNSQYLSYGGDTVSYRDSMAAVQVNLTTGLGTGGTAQGDKYVNIENITGSAYADSLTGNALNNVISGYEGNDIIYGNGGNDTLNGGAGMDFILAGVGNDVLVGDNGEDASFDYLLGEDGNDTLTGGRGGDYLSGGNGIDTVNYLSSAAGVTVNLATGTGRGGDAEGDMLNTIEYVNGSQYNDVITGDAQANVLKGFAGNDTLSGGGGNDILLGGTGNNVLNGDAGNDMFQVDNTTSVDSFNGGEGNDGVSYVPANAAVQVDLLLGKGTGGAATGDTFAGVENVYGGSGDDVLMGDDLANVLDGSYGNNTLLGRGGNDSLMSGSGFDYLDGGAGDDMLQGLGGSDTLVGGAGADRLYGGEGADTASYLNSTAAVTIDLLANTATGGEATGDVLADIENLNGSSYNDYLFGNNLVNVITGQGGNDFILGLGGNDYLYGDAGNDSVLGGDGNDVLNGGIGNDTIEGGAGADSIYGGDGNDTVIFSNATAGVMVNVGGGSAGGDAVGDTYNSIEAFVGSLYDDVIYSGLATAITLQGGAGNDTLTGSQANDVLMGGTENDRVYGGAGNDQIEGQSGFDFLNGEAGNDTLTGGFDADTFAFSNWRYAGVDRITDFKLNEDHIELGAITFELGYGADANPFTAKMATFVQSGSSALLQIDVDGTGTAAWVTLASLDNQNAALLNASTNLWV